MIKDSAIFQLSGIFSQLKFDFRLEFLKKIAKIVNTTKSSPLILRGECVRTQRISPAYGPVLVYVLSVSCDLLFCWFAYICT